MYKHNYLFKFLTVFISFLFISAFFPKITWLVGNQCPDILSSSNNSGGSACVDDIITFSLTGQDLPIGGTIDWYTNATNGFNPYSGQGTFIGSSNISAATLNPCTPCPSIAAIQVDACGTEFDNEFMVLSSGGGFTANDLYVDFDASNNNFSAINNDINTGSNPCSFQTPSAALIADLQSNTGCSNNFTAIGPGGDIPPGVMVLIFTSSNVTANFVLPDICNAGEEIYVLQSNCMRSLGAFTNNGASAIRTYEIGLNSCGCSNNLSYDRSLLPADGFVYFDVSNTLQYVGAGCSPPISTVPINNIPPITTPNVVSDFQWTVTNAYCNTTQYIVGIVNPFVNTSCPNEFTQYFPISISCPQPTITGNLSFCAGGNTTLDAGAGYSSYSWSGTGDNTQTTTVSNAGVYTVTVSDGGCTGTASVTVTELPSPTANTASISLCDNGSGQSVFNLTSVNNTVSGGSGTVSWFSDMNAMTTIIDPFNYLSSTTTVYATVSDGSCNSNPVAVTLTVRPLPTANTAAISLCDEGSNQATFDLTSVNNTVNGGSGTVSWFTDMNATNAINTPSNYISGSTTVYATVNDGTCLSTPVGVSLTVLSLPTANIAALSLCDEGSNQATFDLTTLNNTVNGGNGNTVSWYIDITGQTTIGNPSAYQSGTTTIYATVNNGACESATAAITLTVLGLPTANTAALSLCDEGSTQATFDLTTLDNTVNGGSGNTVSWYTDVTAQTTIGNPTAYLSGTTTVYAAVNDGACESATAAITLTVLGLPTANTAALSLCDEGSTQATFDLTTLNNTVNGGSGNTVSWYTDVTAQIAIGNPTAYLSSTTTVYATVNDGNCTSTSVAVNLTVLSLPTANTAALSLCDEGGTQATFDLTTLDDTVNGGSGNTVSWYTDITGQTVIGNPTTYLSGTNTVYATVNNGACESATAAVTLTILGLPTANTAALSLCDEGSNQATFDLTTLDNTVNGGSGNTVSWYTDITGQTAIGNPTTYLSGTNTIYATVDNGACESATAAVTLTILGLPTANTAALSLCDEGSTQATFDLTTLNNTINGGNGNTVAWYADVTAQTAIGNPTAYQSNTTTVYATVNNGTCESITTSVMLTVLALPTANMTSLSACDTGSGQATFDLTSIENIINGGSGSIAWFLDANGTQSIGNPNNFTSGATTVYATVSDGTCTSNSVGIPLIILITPIANPASLTACNNGSNQATFDLTTLNNTVNGGTGNTISWYSDINAMNAIINPTTYTSGAGTVYAVVSDGTCPSEIVAITLSIEDTPNANTANLEACDEGSGQATFDLTTLNTTVSGGTGTVNWFTDINATNSINNPSSYQSTTTTIYATVNNGNCTSPPVSVSITVLSLPTANTASLSLCEVSGGQATFDLSTIENTISGGVGIVSWFTDMNGINAIINPSAYQTFSTIIYAQVSDGTCSSVLVPITLMVNNLPFSTNANLALCDEGSGQATFDLTSVEGIVSGGLGTITWYADAALTNIITNTNAYLSGNTNVFALVNDGTCDAPVATVTLTVNSTPTANAASLSECDNGSGQATFDLTTIENAISGGVGTVNWFQDNTGSNAISNPNNYTNSSTNVYAQVDNGNCTSVLVAISLTINPLPTANDTSLAACDEGSGQGTFDLTTLITTISGGVGTVNFFQDVGLLISINNPSNYNSGTGVVYATVNDGLCNAVPANISLTVNPLPSANSTAIALCDEGNNQALFDLTTVNSSINNTGIIAWFTDVDGNNPIANPGAFLSGNNTVYATVNDGSCTSETVAINLMIDDLPVANTASLTLCDEGSGQATFNLTSLETTIGIGVVLWYSNSTATNLITNTSSYLSATNTVYATLDDGTCTSNPVAIDLIVSTLPVATPTSLALCDEGSGQATFDLTSIETTVNNGIGTVTWYQDVNATTAITLPANYLSNTSTVYATVNDGACTSNTVMISLVVNSLPIANPTSLALCDEGSGQATFDLTSLETVVSNGVGTVDWYEDVNATTVITAPAAYLSNTTTIYATVNDGTCTSNTVMISLVVNSLPVANSTNLALCDEGGGFATFDLMGVDNIVSGGVGVVNWYTDIDTNNPISNPASFVSVTNTVYATVNDGTCTSNAVSISLIVNGLPVPVSTMMNQCDEGSGQAIFDLTSIEGIISAGNGTVNWYTDNTATSPIVNPASFISTSTTVFATLSNVLCTSSPISINLVVETLAAPTVICGAVTTNDVTFNWLDIGVSNYEITVSINSGPTTTQIITGNTYTASGLNSGDVVLISVIGLGTAPCANSVASSTTCVAANCPTIITSIDNLNTEYCNNEAAFMLMASPAGGTFSGNGVNGNQFDPSTVAGSATTITYNYIDINTNCTYQTTASTIIEIPLGTPVVTCGTTTTNAVTFNWGDIGAVNYEVSVSINGTTPVITTTNNLTFTQSGLMADDNLSIEVIGIGMAPCGNSDAGLLMCSAAPCPVLTPTINNVVSQYCQTDGAVTLMATPSGGAFSGSGVTGNTFDPTAISGNITIMYDYTDPNTGCDYQTSVNTEIVDPIATPIVSCGASTTNEVTFNWTDVGATNYEITVTINGGVPTTQNISANFFTQTGLSANDVVDISVVAIGTPPCGNSIAGIQSCVAEDCSNISVTINNLNATYCNDITPFFLEGTPSGGTFSGSGVIGSIFNPSTVNGSMTTIVYDYIDPNTGCDYQTSVVVNIEAAVASPTVSCGVATTSSVEFNWTSGDANQYEVSISINGGTPTTFLTNNLSYLENGLMPNDAVTIEVVAIGTNPCSDSTPSILTCNAAGCPAIVPTINNVNANYCNSDESFELQATPTGGTFSGLGVVGITFDPAIADNGMVTVTYDYQDPNTGCDYQATIQTEVFTPINTPIISCGSTTPNAVEFNWIDVGVNTFLVDVFINGSLSTSQNITGNTFQQAGLSEGDEVMIEVTALGTPPCGNSLVATQTCTASNCADLPLTISGLADQYCINDAVVILSANPSGGTFSGSGMTGNIFDPMLAGVGTTNVFYDYTDPTNGCDYQIAVQTEVLNPLPAPIINCMNATTNEVTFEWSDLGVANYEISIFINGTLDGTQTTDQPNFIQSGLSANDEVTINVMALGDPPCGNSPVGSQTCNTTDCPAINLEVLNLSDEYCENVAAFELLGAPAGGEFMVNGIITNTLDPTLLAAGLVDIVYTYEDQQSACTYSLSASTNILAIPAASTPSCGVITTNSVEFNWTAVTGVTDYEFTITVNGDFLLTDTTVQLTYLQTGLSENDEVMITLIPLSDNGCDNAMPSTVTCTTTGCSNINLTIDNLEASYCTSAEAFELLGTPAGGTFFINGATNNILIPSDIGIGQVEVTYEYTDELTNCTYSTTEMVSIITQPATPEVLCGNITSNTIQFLWNDVGVNEYEIVLNINGDEQPAEIINDTEYFATNLAVDDEVSISVTAIGLNTCGNSFAGMATCTTADCPTVDVSIDNLEDAYCQNDTSFLLIGTPAGGVFTQNGNIITNFNPSSYPAGMVNVVYTYTDLATACSYAVSNPTTIVTPFVNPVISCGVSTINSVQFNWNDVGVTTYMLSININGGTAMTTTTNQTTYTQTGLNLIDEVTIMVVPVSNDICATGPPSTATCFAADCPPIAISIDNLNQIYCENEAAFELMGSPAGGTFTLDGTIVTTFDPMAFIGDTVTIAYQITDSVTGCEYEVTQTVEVFEELVAPIVSCTSATQEDVIFSWNDVGVPNYEVTFSINGGMPTTQIVNGLTFGVADLMIGDIVDISVVAVGNVICGNSEAGVSSCQTDDCPDIQLSIDNLEEAYCNDVLGFQLIGSPAGGIFTINGIESDTLNPSTIGAGVVNISYEYVEAATNCAYELNQTVTIVNTVSTPLIICENVTTNSISFSWTDAGTDNYLIEYSINGGAAVTVSPPTGIFDFTVNDLEENDDVFITVMAIAESPCQSMVSETIVCTAAACPEVFATLELSNATICLGDTAILSLNFTGSEGPFDVTLTIGGDEQTFINVNSGETLPIIPTASIEISFISVINQDNPACAVSLGNSINLTVTENIELEFTILSDYEGFGVSCFNLNDGMVNVNPIGGTAPYDYLWSNNENTTTAEVLSSGWSFISVTDANGCIGIDSVFLTSPEPSVPVFEIADIDCFGNENGRFEILEVTGGIPEYLYSLDGQPFSNEVIYDDLVAGSYSLVIQDMVGCETIREILIMEPAPLTVDLGADTTLFLGATIDLNPITNAETVTLYNWTGVDCNNCPMVSLTGLANVNIAIEVTNEKGCTATDDITINVVETDGLFWPNVFSPNGDMTNDVFHPYSVSGSERILHLTIFERRGGMVYEARDFSPNDPAVGWRGLFRGEEAASAVYVWEAEIQLIDGTIYEDHGDVILMR